MTEEQIGATVPGVLAGRGVHDAAALRRDRTGSRAHAAALPAHGRRRHRRQRAGRGSTFTVRLAAGGRGSARRSRRPVAPAGRRAPGASLVPRDRRRSRRARRAAAAHASGARAFRRRYRRAAARRASPRARSAPSRRHHARRRDAGHGRLGGARRAQGPTLATAGIPVVMLTMRGRPEPRLRPGRGGYLTKPVDRERLVAVLRARPARPAGAGRRRRPGAAGSPAAQDVEREATGSSGAGKRSALRAGAGACARGGGAILLWDR